MRKSKLNTTTGMIIVAMTAGVVASSCTIRKNTSEEIQQSTSGTSLGVLKVNVNKYASSKIVCDPLDADKEPSTPKEEVITTYENGIKASLHYLIEGMPRMYKSTDYVTFGYKSSQDIFMKDINVPTRMFTEGFVTVDGKVLNNDNNQKLIEYFGLKMNSHVVLTADDAEGDYEFALLSDDGVTLSILGEDSSEVLIDGDGDHPTRFSCAKRTVNMKKDTMLPIELTYYQGPRYHIANMMLYRSSSTAGKDSSCGKNGNELFFDPNNGSKPKQAYHDLIARGWKVLTPQHFVLSKKTEVVGGGDDDHGPGDEDYNPCVKGTNPVISNFSLNDVVSDAAYFVWYTDIPATAQLELTNTQTGEVTTTTSDNLLRTIHVVEIKNLQPDVTYRVKAISVSEDLGRTKSSEEVLLRMSDHLEI